MYRQHIRGIIDELIKNSIKAKATKIDTSIEIEGNFIKISVIDNGKGMSQERLNLARKRLYQQRRYELEDYYGALAGDGSVDDGLSLVGMMTDEAEIFTEEGKGTTVKVAFEVNLGR